MSLAVAPGRIGQPDRRKAAPAFPAEVDRRAGLHGRQVGARRNVGDDIAVVGEMDDEPRGRSLEHDVGDDAFDGAAVVTGLRRRGEPLGAQHDRHRPPVRPRLRWSCVRMVAPLLRCDHGVVAVGADDLARQQVGRCR